MAKYEFTRQAIKGTDITDLGPLKKALERFEYEEERVLPWSHIYESDPAVKHLCDWWNKRQASANKPGAYFYLYFWDTKTRRFVAGDWEAPSEEHELCQNTNAGCLFIEGSLVVFALFLQSRSSWTYKNGVTTEYTTDTGFGGDTGLEVDLMFPSLYTMRGLLKLKELIQIIPAEGATEDVLHALLQDDRAELIAG